MMMTTMLVALHRLFRTVVAILSDVKFAGVRRVIFMRLCRIGMNAGQQNRHYGEKGKESTHGWRR